MNPSCLKKIKNKNWTKERNVDSVQFHLYIIFVLPIHNGHLNDHTALYESESGSWEAAIHRNRSGWGERDKEA